MQITHIESFLVSPGKNMENPPDVTGIIVPLKGRLYNMLNVVFENSDTECDIPIKFKMSKDGKQINEVRNYMLAFADKPGILTGKALATRLRDYTTQKSGLALLFIILGKDDNSDRKKIVLSRFPADEGIVADISSGQLQIDYIERIFMKNKKYHKAAMYKNYPRGDWWQGLAVDKQIDGKLNELADYWIFDFLSSEFITTTKSGTRRLALAVKGATNRTDEINSKQELIAFSTFSRNQAGRKVSITKLVEDFNPSERTSELITSHYTQDVNNETFVFDAEEFVQHVAYTSIELDNGGMLTAPQGKFDECFDREIVDDNEGIIRFSTEGRIVDEKIRSRKS